MTKVFISHTRLLYIIIVAQTVGESPMVTNHAFSRQVSEKFHSFRNENFIPQLRRSRLKKNVEKSINYYNILYVFKDVGEDNWAIFYIFSREVFEKPGFKNDLFNV